MSTTLYSVSYQSQHSNSSHLALILFLTHRRNKRKPICLVVLHFPSLPQGVAHGLGAVIGKQRRRPLADWLLCNGSNAAAPPTVHEVLMPIGHVSLVSSYSDLGCKGNLLKRGLSILKCRHYFVSMLRTKSPKCSNVPLVV